MLKDKELKAEIIWWYHDVLAAGYEGRQKTVELVTKNYWWLGITRDVGRYVEEYDLCQQMKNRTEKVAGKSKLGEVSEKPQMYILVDFITKLPIVAGKNTILVVCDRLSKIMYFIATMERTLAEGLARLFRDNVWRLYELPESVVLDRGPQFTVELTEKLNRMLSIKTKLSTTFHLQTDGQTEGMNQELEQYLQFFVDYKQKDWPKQLALAEFTINNKVHSITKVSLFITNYSRELRMGGDIRRKEKVKKATEFVEKLKRVQEEVETALKKTQKEMKRYTDRNRKKTEE